MQSNANVEVDPGIFIFLYFYMNYIEDIGKRNVTNLAV